MKKLIATALVTMMMMSMGMTAFAADKTIEEEKGTASTDVTATYVAGEDGGIVYNVDVTWGSMEFKYTSEAKGTWNPETHSYENEAVAKWEYDEGANVITVTNHTNAAVKADLTYDKASNYEAVTGTFDNNSLSLATAEKTEVTAAPTATAALTLSGSMPEATGKTTVGTVTVTLK